MKEIDSILFQHFDQLLQFIGIESIFEFLMNGKLITDREADGIPLFDCMNDFHRQTHPVLDRMRLPMEIVHAIKQRDSISLPISYQFSIHEKLEDGYPSSSFS